MNSYKYTLTRLFAIGTVVFAENFLANYNQLLHYAYTPIAMAHFILAYYYSKDLMKTSTSRRLGRLLFGVATLAALLVLYLDLYPIGWTLAFHLAMTDSYLLAKQKGGIDWLTGSRFVFNFLFIIKLLDGQNSFDAYGANIATSVPIIDELLFFFGVLTFFLLFRQKGSRDSFAFEGCTLLFLGLHYMMGLQIRMESFVLYHCIQWWVLPSFARGFGRPQWIRYGLQNVTVALVVFCIIHFLYRHGPWSGFKQFADLIIYPYAVAYFGTLHIFMTPFMSRLNPAFWNRWIGF